MPENTKAEDLLNNLVETMSETQKSFFEEGKSSQFNRLFGREKPVHHILGGGKSADVLLWRNKKISAGVLSAATAVWVFFEWLDYHLLTLVCLALVLGLIAQFLWINVSGFMDKRSSRVPRLVLPEELFVNLAKSVGAEVNRALGFLQDAACGGNLKQFLVVVGSLWVASIIGSWCNFLTVLYIGFVAAHTLPVVYERYDDQIDGFVDNVLNQFHHHYRKLDTGLLSKIPKGKLHYMKRE